MTAASRAQDTQVVSEEDVKNWFSDSSSGLAKQCVELANWLRMNKVSFTSPYQSRKQEVMMRLNQTFSRLVVCVSVLIQVARCWRY